MIQIRKSGCIAVAMLLALALVPMPASAQDNPNSKRPFTYDPGRHASAADHYAALKAAAGDPATPAYDKLPDWKGLWTRDIAAEGFSVRPREKRTGVGYQTEIQMKLTPEYQARYDKMIADFKAGKGDWDPLSFCLPAGYPRWHVEPFLKEFVVRPEETWLINEQQSEVRRIYTDGRAHLPEDIAFPTWTGDSIGFWRGQTLVIWTKGVKANIYQRQQPEHSDKVETIEEWTKIEPRTMEVRMTIYDSEALREPFPLIRYYYGVDDDGGNLRLAMWSCNENNPNVRTADGSTDVRLPGEADYRPPVTDAAVPSAIEKR
ncbi:hypothetical protein [Arenibaculum pallidiluteum]|uniref:hypothetical protein n=1 Tax=Arenibaculum pallidiluteum TaxID=2812559 RepID=UPI001A9685FE|nr:hypothetical protein [Arenibaculum pallidiluteum]